jgi:hypothetical protein
MWILLLGAVVIPVGAVVLFALLEFASTKLTIGDVLLAASRDMCNVSIGIVGGLFGISKLQTRLGSGAPIEAITLVGLNVILSAVAFGVSKRGSDLGMAKQSTQATVCLFIGCVSIAIPSLIILLIGGSS